VLFPIVFGPKIEKQFLTFGSDQKIIVLLKSDSSFFLIKEKLNDSDAFTFVSVFK